MNIDLTTIPTPCYVIDKTALTRNLEILSSVQKKTSCKILLALKAFAMFSVFPLIRSYLAGTAASSLDEARLGHEEFKGETHVYTPAFKEEEFEQIIQYADCINFNSFSQWQRFKPFVDSCKKDIRCGMRINPEYSEVPVEIYNPCARYSRLGVTADAFRNQDLSGLSGLLFHTCCEQNVDALERTLKVVEEKFGAYIGRMKWINFGGGQHITQKNYDIEKLCALIVCFKKHYDVEVYLEPGEAVVLEAGVLVTSVLDIIKNEIDIAILDTSASAHMPDVLEMPYKPEIEGAAEKDRFPHTYRLGGLTCLAGDVIGDYSFPEPLKVGSKIVFRDMAHYTMVKNTTFNGVRQPSIALYDPEDGKIAIVRSFGFDEYKSRLS